MKGLKLVRVLCRFYVAGMLTAFFSMGLRAQSTVFNLGSITVEAESGETSQGQGGGNTTVISRKSIKTHKVVDLSEVIADELVEASMVRKSGYGNEVGLRGFTKSNLRFTSDGTLVEGSCGSRKDPPLSHINMISVGEMQINEGPFDVAVPGALGGSVNVKTKDPQKGFHGETQLKYGSFDFMSLGGFLTGGNDIIQGLFGYNFSRSGQYKDGSGNPLTSFNQSYTEAGKAKDAFSKHDFWGKINFDMSDKQRLTVTSSYGAGKDILSPRTGMDIKQEKTFMNKIEYAHSNLGSMSELLSLSAYYNRIEHYPYGEYRSGVVNTRRIEALSGITGAKVENKTMTSFAGLTCGIDFYYRSWDGKLFSRETGEVMNPNLFPDVGEVDFGGYIKADRDIGLLSITAGLRGDMFKSKAGGSLIDSLSITQTNEVTEIFPGGNIFLKYYALENITLFGGAGVSTRTPTAVERYTQQGSTFYGNPDLKSARNHEADLGLEVTPLKRIKIKGKGFYSYITDYIYQTTVPAKTWTNIDVYIAGGDFTVAVEPVKGLTLNGAVSCQTGRKIDTLSDNNDKDLAEIPPLKSRVDISWNRNDLSLSVEWTHSESDTSIDSPAGERRLDGWDVFNLKIGYRFTEEKNFFSFMKGTALNLGINNVFNKTYAVSNSYEYDPTDVGGNNVSVVNEPGRFIYGSLTYSF